MKTIGRDPAGSQYPLVTSITGTNCQPGAPIQIRTRDRSHHGRQTPLQGEALSTKYVKLALGEYLRLNMALPWNVYSEQGHLLLKKGSIPFDQRQLESLVERGAYVSQDDLEKHRRTIQEQEEVDDDPIEPWRKLQGRLAPLLNNPDQVQDFPQQLEALAAEVVRMTDAEPDLAIFAMMRLNQVDYAVVHALQAGVACDVYGHFLRADAADRKLMVCAALTMNIGMMDLHRELAWQAEPPTPEQRARIPQHPGASHERLVALGITDPRWLQAVLEHHETPDGKGYPKGQIQISREADVLAVADRYCAMLSRRRRRAAMTTNRAARELYVSGVGERQAIIARMIKAFGLYPPGAYVKLANGEISVVVKRGEHANKPQVVSLISSLGTSLTAPLLRDTATETYAVTIAVEEQNVASPFSNSAILAVAPRSKAT